MMDSSWQYIFFIILKHFGLHLSESYLNIFEIIFEPHTQ